MSCVLLSCFLLTLMSTVHCHNDYWEYEMDDYTTHPCVRPCGDNAPPRLCKYTWTVENYYVLSKACFDCPYNQSHCSLPQCVPADGVTRGIKTANRMMPGPAVQVCEGDTVEVTVDNRLDGSESTTIHWHGILQQGTPHMDGTGMVTQCPISYSSEFTYRFMTKDTGTHYWHAHIGPQRADGLYGPFIVRQAPTKEPHFHLYDNDLPEHVILLSDWTIDIAATRFAKYIHFDGDNKPRLMLINGQGQYRGYEDTNTNNTYYTPHASFTVTPGQRYRFRLINSGIMNCALQFSIDSHTMAVIASDGSPIEPFITDSLTIYTGERFDFVLQADKNDTLRNYWIRVRGYGNCDKHKTTQTAILKYDGAPESLPPETTTWEDGIRDGINLNPASVTGVNTSKEMTDMLAMVPDDDVMTSPVDKQFYMALDFTQIENKRSHNPLYYPRETSSTKFYSPQLNWISHQLPPSPPLTQLDDIPEEMFCNAETTQINCKEEWCACVHLYRVGLGDLVEIIVVDEGTLSHAYHPMHLHGYKFRVVGMGKISTKTTVEEVKELDRRGELNRTTTRAPLKDTVIVPDGGYTVLRFRANNPGFWLFHCHVEFHSEAGMAMVFQVGTQSQFPKRPKNFPTCGSWRFNGYEETTTKAVDHVTRTNTAHTISVFDVVVLCVLFQFMLPY